MQIVCAPGISGKQCARPRRVAVILEGGGGAWWAKVVLESRSVATHWDIEEVHAIPGGEGGLGVQRHPVSKIRTLACRLNALCVRARG